MRIALLSADDRECQKRYDLAAPLFPPPQEGLLQGFAGMAGVEIHFIACLQEPVQTPAKLADNIWLHCLHVPKAGWMRSLYFGCIRAIRRRLAEIEPEVVHAQGTERECGLAAVRSGYPNVLTIHGIMQEQARIMHSRPGSFHWLAARMETYALRRTNGVLCNSAYTEKMIQPRTTKTWRVANPLRPAYFSSPAPAMNTGKCICLNVGYICGYKRQNELIAAMAELRRTGLEFELHFAGKVNPDDPYCAQFLGLVEKHGDFVKYLGYQSTAQLLELYDRVSALIHVSGQETFGLAVAEALTRNLKLFAFRVGGIPDVAGGVEGAELIPDQDWHCLQSAVSQWIKAGYARPTKATDEMRSRFHPQVIARQHVEIYREVLALH